VLDALISAGTSWIVIIASLFLMLLLFSELWLANLLDLVPFDIQTTEFKGIFIYILQDSVYVQWQEYAPGMWTHPRARPSFSAVSKKCVAMAIK
jgi:hypothetical protein